ncbi:MAG: TorD/DmsD family molecular chaperone [Pseudobdellovibrionaceae bacterium]
MTTHNPTATTPGTTKETEITSRTATINPSPFVLASILTSYPDEAFGLNVEALLDDEDIELPVDLREKLQTLVRSEEKLNDLRSDYIAIFDQSKSLNPLYETEYGRERAMFKANELSDVAGFYKAFGFELVQDGSTKEMIDHISVELEFYSLMQMKHLYLQDTEDFEGCEIVFDAMKKFMNDHLGRFVETISKRPGVQAHALYLSIFQWIADIVAKECERTGVKPDKVSWLSSQVEDEAVCCGSTVAMNKQ